MTNSRYFLKNLNHHTSASPKPRSMLSMLFCMMLTFSSINFRFGSFSLLFSLTACSELKSPFRMEKFSVFRVSRLCLTVRVLEMMSSCVILVVFWIAMKEQSGWMNGSIDQSAALYRQKEAQESGKGQPPNVKRSLNGF